MGNEKATDMDERILRMTDAEICEILIDKAGWQVEMYSRAVSEAKKRKIGFEQLQEKHQEAVIQKEVIATAELTRPEKVMFMFSFVLLPVGILMEKYRAEGYTKKLEQAKFYKMIGTPIIFGLALTIGLLFCYVRYLIEPKY